MGEGTAGDPSSLRAVNSNARTTIVMRMMADDFGLIDAVLHNAGPNELAENQTR